MHHADFRIVAPDSAQVKLWARLLQKRNREMPGKNHRAKDRHCSLGKDLCAAFQACAGSAEVINQHNRAWNRAVNAQHSCQSALPLCGAQ